MLTEIYLRKLCVITKSLLLIQISVVFDNHAYGLGRLIKYHREHVTIDRMLLAARCGFIANFHVPRVLTSRGKRTPMISLYFNAFCKRGSWPLSDICVVEWFNDIANSSITWSWKHAMCGSIFLSRREHLDPKSWKHTMRYRIVLRLLGHVVQWSLVHDLTSSRTSVLRR